MSTATVSVPGIHWDHRTVAVDVDEAAVDLAAVRDAIEDRGYAVPAER